MPDAIQVLTLQDQMTPAVKNAVDKLTHPKPLLTVLGKRLEGDLKGHFLERNAEPNKRGWPKQNFWNQIRRATLFTKATDETATVTIADPRINPHVYGGTIYPTEAKFLTIPAREEAVGIMPKSGLIPGLHFAVLPKGGPVLLQRSLSQITFVKDRRKGRDGQRRPKLKGLSQLGEVVMYWLKRFVKIPRDPRALPPTDKLQKNLAGEAGQWVGRNVTS